MFFISYLCFYCFQLVTAFAPKMSCLGSINDNRIYRYLSYSSISLLLVDISLISRYLSYLYKFKTDVSKKLEFGFSRLAIKNSGVVKSDD